MRSEPLRVGILGLGAASAQILPAFGHTEGVVLGGVADIRHQTAEEVGRRHDVPACNSVEELCARDDVDAVWVATPNPLHARHVVTAAELGKHVICEKPMAVTLAEADAMISACERNRVRLIQGHSKIYETPIRSMRAMITGGSLGRAIQINTWNFNDWLLRPRLASEVDTSRGGGVVYRQGPHQVDIVRCLGGGMVGSVRAVAGRRLRGFDTEGDYTALLVFDEGLAATAVFNGYGQFEVAELTWNITEGGRTIADAAVRRPRPVPPGPVSETTKYASNGTPTPADEDAARSRHQPFFGLTVVGCERGDLRQSPEGLFIYTPEGRREISCPPEHGRSAELRELVGSVTDDRPAFPDGRWGKATLEVCLAVLESSRTGKEVPLQHQVPVPPWWVEPLTEPLARWRP